jgi:hypothetical protein
LFITINKPEGNEDEQKKLETDDAYHLGRAKEMQKSLNTESQQNEDNHELGIAVITVDLQQAVPTKMLSSSACISQM